MKRCWSIVAGILLSIAALGGAQAAPETLFSSDFQNDTIAGWVPGGKGGIEVTNYQGNYSMHMTGHAEAIATVKTDGFASVTIAASWAAYKLTPHDKCAAEYSLDAGKSWEEVTTLRPGRDNGVSMYPGHTGAIDVSKAPVLLVRLRAQLSVGDASCWGDAVSVTGERAGTAAPQTQHLLLNDLKNGTVPGPVRMAALARPPSATPPTQTFEGRLTLDAASFNGGFQVVRNTPYNIAIDGGIKSLPPFDFSFVQDGGALVPVQRGAVASTHPDWEFVLEPGEVWSEPGDVGYVRAALPFSLRERNANCLHNGVMSFAFKSDGTVSHVYFQISSETCAYFKFNAWGSAPAHYTPGAVANAAALREAWRGEVAARLPVKPISELIAAHPALSATGLGLAPPADGDLPTLYGVVVDGVNYVGGCDTRAGPYPYCDVLDLPSYSTAKTVLGAIGLMRLEKLWPGARNALISDYVPACATPDWAGVTFENALDMVTGVYGDAAFEADENSGGARPFFLADTHVGKIAFACGHYHRGSPPGKTWVYHSWDSYVLGTAMQEFVRRHLGPNADLYRDIHVAQLWRKLHLSPVLDTSLRTYDAVQQPYTGYGLTYHRDDIARIAEFLGPSSGAIGGEKMLDDAMLARALQRDAAHPGMPAGFPQFTYVDGTWAWDLAPVLGCARPARAPFLSGFGGNSVVMLPNGIVYYYFGDSQVFDWSAAAVEINKLKPICS